MFQFLGSVYASQPMKLPYRSRFGSGAKNFTDFASWRANNCVAQKGTNGFDLYGPITTPEIDELSPEPLLHFQQQPRINRDRRQPMNVILDSIPLSDIDLPEELQPVHPALNESYTVAQFYMLNDNTTGVLALGSFSAPNFTAFQISLAAGLIKLKERGATQLIVDVVGGRLYDT